MIHVGYSVEISTNLDETGKQGKERANGKIKAPAGAEFLSGQSALFCIHGSLIIKDSNLYYIISLPIRFL